MADARPDTWRVLWLRSRPAPLPFVVVVDEELGGFRLPEVVGRVAEPVLDETEERKPPKLLEKRTYLGLVVRHGRPSAMQ